MSFIAKVVAAVTPLESAEARRRARDRARAAARPGDWLTAVLDQHLRIEAGFLAVATATSMAGQVAAQKRLATLLIGHATAEEAVLYPALAATHQTGHATRAYTEQAAAKLQMGLLERLVPLSAGYRNKLEQLRGAVVHHLYEEEAIWFLKLKDRAPAGEQIRLSNHYQQEFTRYMESTGPSTAGRPAGRSLLRRRADHVGEGFHDLRDLPGLDDQRR